VCVPDNPRHHANGQRVHRVGDILTVKLNINDTAEFQDQTQPAHSTTADSQIANVIGANTIPIRPKRCCPEQCSPPETASFLAGNYPWCFACFFDACSWCSVACRE
jgi:hypothetical protein